MVVVVLDHSRTAHHVLAAHIPVVREGEGCGSSSPCRMTTFRKTLSSAIHQGKGAKTRAAHRP